MSCSEDVANPEPVRDFKCNDEQPKGLEIQAIQHTQSLPDLRLRVLSTLIVNDRTPSSSTMVEHITELNFRNEFRRKRDNKKLKDSCKEMSTRCCKCSSDKSKRIIDKILPGFKMVRKYNIKDDLVNDIVAGLTVGFLQIPQSMAFAMLANLPPVLGLYTTFFPVFIYFIFGTSRHIAMGTTAVGSLLTGRIISKFEALESSSYVGAEVNNSTNNMTSLPGMAAKLSDSTKIGIVMGLALLVGIMQFGMGLLRLGVIKTYISDSMVGGSTTGIGLLIYTSQAKHILGITIPKMEGMFQLIRTWTAIIEDILKTNIATVIISLISMAILYIVKDHINQRFKHKLRVPIPVDLIVVILGTVASYTWDYQTRFNVKIVGDVQTGLPMPAVPKLERPHLYVPEAVIIAIQGFVASVAQAGVMAKKHSYIIHPSQELIAYGLGNIFGSFFSCYPYSASMAATFAQASAGGKTEVASLFTATLMVVVIVWLGYLLKWLPNAILASVIIISLRHLLMQFGDLPRIWRISRFDFFIWIVTCACTALIDVYVGLLAGVVFSFFTVVIRTQTAIVSPLGKIDDPNLYRNSKKYVTGEQHEGIKIVDFNCPLYFANADIFVTKLQRITGIKPEKISKQLRRMSRLNSLEREDTFPTENNVICINAETSLDSPPSTIMNGRVKSPVPSRADICPVHHIIIDFSAVSFIDSVGAKIIKQVFEDYSKIEVTIFLACVSDDVWELLDTVEFLKKYSGNIFPTVEVAMAKATKEAEDGVVNEISTMFRL